MILAFETEELRTVCEDPDVAATLLSAAIASQLRGRLADLRAGTSISDLLVGNPRLGGTRSENLTIDLAPEVHMVWTANHVNTKTRVDGHIDWSRVSRVRLLKIEVSND
jgi:hypothetical protein